MKKDDKIIVNDIGNPIGEMGDMADRRSDTKDTYDEDEFLMNMDDGRETRNSLNKGIDPHVPDSEKRVRHIGIDMDKENVESNEFRDMLHDKSEVSGFPFKIEESVDKPGRGRIDLMKQAGFTIGDPRGVRSTENKNVSKDEEVLIGEFDINDAVNLQNIDDVNNRNKSDPHYIRDNVSERDR